MPFLKIENKTTQSLKYRIGPNETATQSYQWVNQSPTGGIEAGKTIFNQPFNTGDAIGIAGQTHLFTYEVLNGTENRTITVT